MDSLRNTQEELWDSKRQITSLWACGRECQVKWEPSQGSLYLEVVEAESGKKQVTRTTQWKDQASQKSEKIKKKRPDRKSLSHFPILLMKGKKHELWKFLSSHPGGHCQKRQQAILKQLWMLREAVKNHKLFEKHRDHKIK